MEKVALFEAAATKRNRVCRFVTKQELQEYKGYRTVYGFDELTVAYFKDVGSTRGSKNIAPTVFADELLLDFDSGVDGYDAQEEATKMWNWLVSNDYSFTAWDSGGRSIHLHIPHQAAWHKHWPYSHLMFMRGIGVKSDESIFQAGRLFRLPGTVHETTLKKKTLIGSHEGSKLLEIPLLIEPIKQKSHVQFDGEGVIELATKLMSVANRPYVNGERNRRFFCLAMCCLSGGFSSDFTRELLDKVNDELLEEPIDDNEMELLLNSAIQSLGV
jgi:hypothetical protein